ncbi:hypothetical protein ACPPVV_08390 [Rhodanobacter sp. Col0626]|uniref:hypothetical protein n=1 Tax=Rhodanobacter sp. Col0626 TaxID=3415679 RepID=UPI003CF3B221
MNTRRSVLIDPIRRGVAFGIALSLHFMLLITVLRFAGREPDRPADHRDNEKPMLLRLFAPSVSPPVQPGKPAAGATAGNTHRIAGQAAPRVPAMRMPTPHVAAQVSTAPLVAPRSDAPATTTNNHAEENDGGFGERLSQARQGFRAARRLPGSSVPRVSGIELIDRDEQGIAALAKKTQRLFGITDRHCIDVDVWSRLTPDELSERHISPNDVDRVSDAHHCNRPLGLSF